METKICASCHKEKLLDCFSRDKNAKDGLKRYCKDCISTKSRIYREKNRNEINARKRNAYYALKEHAEKRTAEELKEGTRVCSVCGLVKPLSDFYLCGNGGFRVYCKACANAKSRNYHREHRHHIISRKREYHREHKDEINAYNHAYYQNHSNKIKTKAREWVKENREESRVNSTIYAQRRRSKAYNLPTLFSKADWKRCKQYFSVGGQLTCAYCGKPLARATQDHLIPVSSGGGYVPENIIPACSSCNSSKQNREFKDWYHDQSFYSPEREERIFEYCNMARQYREGRESDGLCNA